MPPNPPITGFSTNKLHILIYDMVPLLSKERKRKSILAKLSHWYPLLRLIPCKRNNPQQGDGCTNFNFFKALVIFDLHTPQKDKDHDLYKKGVPFYTITANEKLQRYLKMKTRVSTQNSSTGIIEGESLLQNDGSPPSKTPGKTACA